MQRLSMKSISVKLSIRLITPQLVFMRCAYNIPPSRLSPLTFPPLFLCLSKYKRFSPGPLLSFMLVKHIACSVCYQKRNTNDDDGNCGSEALLCKTRERVPGQKAVIAASSRRQGDGKTDSAGH